MVEQTTIRLEKGRLDQFLSNIKIALPRSVGDAGFDLAKKAELNLKMEVMRQNLIWRRKLLNGIQARRLSKFTSVVVIPAHGVHLDSMTPHHVQLKRGRLIRLWALQKGNDRIKGIAKREASIFVRPHPFIEIPIQNAISQLPSIIQRRLEKTISEA